MLVGEKRGGKGTVSRTLSNLIGKENTCSPRLCSLSGEFGLEPLLGKSLATIGEAELGKRVDGKGVGLIIKSLVGEDSVSVNRKNQKAIESRLRVRFVFSCNAIDDFPDASGALADRFILIHSPNSFLGKENQKLETQLDAEIQGIFNWAIEGLFKELFEPRSSSLQREILRESVSTVAIFFHENLERANGEVVLAADVFLAYQQWCYGRCIEAKERSLFHKELKRAFSLCTKWKRFGERSADKKSPYYLDLRWKGNSEILIGEGE